MTLTQVIYSTSLSGWFSVCCQGTTKRCVGRLNACRFCWWADLPSLDKALCKSQPVSKSEMGFFISPRVVSRF